MRLWQGEEEHYHIAQHNTDSQSELSDAGAFQDVASRCKDFIVGEAGAEPTEKTIADGFISYLWSGEDVTGLVCTIKKTGKVTCLAMSTSLSQKALHECPTGKEDEKCLEQLTNPQKNKNDDDTAKLERTWFSQQLKCNNLIEHNFTRNKCNDGSGEIWCLSLMTDYSNPYKALERPHTTITITEGRGMIYCQGIDTDYGRQLLFARKKMYFADGK